MPARNWQQFFCLSSKVLGLQGYEPPGQAIELDSLQGADAGEIGPHELEEIIRSRWDQDCSFSDHPLPTPNVGIPRAPEVTQI